MTLTFSWDLVTGLISFLLTLMVMSYLIGDNPAFRVAIYLFIGVSAGYAAAVAWNQVLKPRLFLPLLQGGWTNLLLLVPFLLGLLMFTKLSPRIARLGSVSLAIIVGVGAAVVVGGAVLGTLFPQTMAVVNQFDLPPIREGAPQWLGKLAEAALMLLGTASTLVFFHFSAKATPGGPRRSKMVEVIAWVGQVFVAITFGVLFAGAFAAAMTALIERMSFLIGFVSQFF
jgi:hypothetical protein